MPSNSDCFSCISRCRFDSIGWTVLVGVPVRAMARRDGVAREMKRFLRDQRKGARARGARLGARAVQSIGSWFYRIRDYAKLVVSHKCLFERLNLSGFSPGSRGTATIIA